VRNWTATLVLIIASISLAGCGLRGPLELPPEAKSRQQQTADAASGQGKAAGTAPKPHKRFILDGLLQ